MEPRPLNIICTCLQSIQRQKIGERLLISSILAFKFPTVELQETVFICSHLHVFFYLTSNLFKYSYLGVEFVPQRKFINSFKIRYTFRMYML